MFLLEAALVVRSARTLKLGILGAGEGEASSAKANRETLEEKILAASADAGVTLTAAGIALEPLETTGSEAWDTDSQLPFSDGGRTDSSRRSGNGCTGSTPGFNEK